MTQLGYRAQRQRFVLDRAPACTLTAGSPQRSAEAVVWANEDYFVDTYRERAMREFRPVTVADLPAVEQQTGLNSGSCVLTVGVANEQSLDVSSYVDDLNDDGTPVADPCAEARRLVEAIVSTLPPL